MTPESAPGPSPSAPVADWEAFYRSYRKPGYVPGFEITSKLGGGMFGLVFKATRQSIGKDYAIKFLKVDDGDVRRAVLQELSQVQYFAQVDHPNLVSIEDRGEVDGIPYLVMAYAGSETLADKLPGKQEDRPELLRWFLQACRGVAALHERSLVHFDLKPANVFLKGSVARVGDYGLSKLVTHSRGSMSMGRGTPYYMAPEMLARRGDHRSDIYSLGVMLYEVLTGELPFRGANEWEVLKQHETAAVTFPPHVGPRERAVVERCLAKDPAQRFAGAHEVIEALGGQLSAGAAAWREPPREGAHASSPPPLPPPPRSAPRPAGPASQERPADDPYAGFKRASREAYAHASTLARKAMGHAHQVAQSAAAEARKAMRAAMQKSHGKQLRRWQAWRRLLASKRAAKKRERILQREQRRAERRARRHRARSSLALVAGISLLFVLLYAGRRGGSVRPDATATPGFMRAVTVLPPQWKGAVTRSEPKWVVLAQQDLTKAQVALQQHVARFEGKAPLARAARIVHVDLPQFGAIATRLDGARWREMGGLVEHLQQARDYDPDQAVQLRAFGRDALFLAAQCLELAPASDERGLQANRNLHRFLQDSTGYRGIQLIEDPALPPAERLEANSKLGTLWSWFLNEVALTDRSWETYCQLRSR